MSKKINVLIVDDEISAIKTLTGILNQYFPHINILDSAQTVNDAYEKAMRHQPDLVFLDVQMPPLGSGFDFLNKCKDFCFGIIFTTAYPQYAIQAINENHKPWGYLIKPISVNKLGQALAMAEEKINAQEKNKEEYLANKKLFIYDLKKGIISIPILNIIFCKADGSTTALYYQKEKKYVKLTTSKILKELEQLLPTNIFCRCHHSYIVNLNTVEEFESTGRNGLVHLKNENKVPVSISKLDFFNEQLSEFLKNKNHIILDK